MKILTVENKKDEKFLRTPVPEIDFAAEDKIALRKTIKEMRLLMIKAPGVGLSANQVGLKKRLFVAQISQENGPPKFYAFINPRILKTSEETEVQEEGCLSIPGVFLPVRRPSRTTIEGLNAIGKKTKIKARGILARIFQHEIDHLDGILITDKSPC